MRFIVLIVGGFLALTALYLMISVYSRSVRREKLEKRWDAHHDGGDPAERAAYIEEGMVQYEKGFRKKLIVLVYVVPVVAVSTIMYLTN